MTRGGKRKRGCFQKKIGAEIIGPRGMARATKRDFVKRGTKAKKKASKPERVGAGDKEKINVIGRVGKAGSNRTTDTNQKKTRESGPKRFKIDKRF